MFLNWEMMRYRLLGKKRLANLWLSSCLCLRSQCKSLSGSYYLWVVVWFFVLDVLHMSDISQVDVETYLSFF